MMDLQQNIWDDPFGYVLRPGWADACDNWKHSCGMQVHENDTFGKLCLFQREHALFEVTYGGWGIRLLPGNSRCEVIRRPAGGLGQVAPFYAHDRIALPFLRLICGCLLLHASCVCIHEKTVVFLARTGVGKSTFAGALLKDKANLILAEDVLAIVKAGGEFVALPSAEYLAMRHHLLDGLGGVVSTEESGEKHILHLDPGRCCRTPRPLSALVLLENGEPDVPVLIQNKHEVLAQILSQQMALSSPPQAFKSAQFRDMMSLIQGVPVYGMRMCLRDADQIQKSMNFMSELNFN